MALRTLLLCTMAAAVAVTLMPTTAATPYNVCVPGNVACVVQTDSPYGGPACDSYAYRYAVNEDFTGVKVNAGPASATAGGHYMCNNYFYNDGDYHGVFATANVNGATAEAYWRAYDVDYHWPGAPADIYGEYLIARVNTGSGYTGVTWQTINTPSQGTSTCDTVLMVQGAPTSLGCPAGGPPAPPALPWGAILP